MTDELLKFYALEGFLARLAVSEFADDFVLKGGVLLAAYAARRPTRDVDLQANNMSNDDESVVTRIQEIMRIPRADGLGFDHASARSDVIREDDEYTGIRVSLRSFLSSATVDFHLDINFGDPIWPEPKKIQLPLLLGGEITLLGYPLHMVIAEKAVTAVQRGTANTRWRDFADIVTLTRHNALIGSDLYSAIQVVAQYRGVKLALLADVLEGMEKSAQIRWSVWRRKQQLEQQLPQHFQEVVSTCIALCDPAIAGIAIKKEWNPTNQRWH